MRILEKIDNYLNEETVFSKAIIIKNAESAVKNAKDPKLKGRKFYIR